MGVSLPKSNLIFLKKCLDKWVHFSAKCGISDKSRIFFQVDHIIPMNAGGKSTLDNLQILCRQCNGQKGDKS